MKPIIFSKTMAQAILAGKKTQTRRAIKPQPIYPLKQKQDGKWCEFSADPRADIIGGSVWGFQHKPRYQVGDDLWVRETFAPWDQNCKYVYRADLDVSQKAKDDIMELFDLKWHPSIHMPREAARIFLRVTGVRCERVQSIKYGDCCAEGVYTREQIAMGYDGSFPFRDLWDSLNAKRGYGWDANPWVFVYEFERVSKEGAIT